MLELRELNEMALSVAFKSLRRSHVALNTWRSNNNLRNGSIQSYIDILPQVRDAIEHKKPLVALESTIITHGMPWPQNLDTALEVEALVREEGATPATIAILNGRIKVGLSEIDLQTLAKKQSKEVTKCSRRDLAFLVSQGRSGGTTVAATMLIANKVGLKIFATGGIGGVHQQGHITMDISADLIELGRTSLAVVCSGVKSILDIPRTLEFLETQGVCVTTYGSPEYVFPDFFTRDSGSCVSFNLQNPDEAARLIRTSDEMQLQSGILIAVPIPAQFAADKSAIKAAIAQAHREANEQHLSGKEVTPFLLAAIAKITGGNSLQANIALIKNNASTAAKIAKALYGSNEIYSISTASAVSAPLVIGASILDLTLTIQDKMPEILDGATYRTKAKQSAGGVGRNIAEGLFKLYGTTNFISRVGNDQLGKSLISLMPEALQSSICVDPEYSTSLCSVIFDKAGDCKLVLGNMEIHGNITPKHVEMHEELLQKTPLIIMDGNLSVQTMECILQLAKKYNKPVFFEPTDMRISGKPFKLSQSLRHQIKFISPNIYELKQIVETITNESIVWNEKKILSKDKLLRETKRLLKLIEQEFDCILVTLGHHGIVLSLLARATEIPLFDANSGKYQLFEQTNDAKRILCYYPAQSVSNIVNVSGAGDSFTSGFITGLLRGYNIDRAVTFGFLAAECSLQAESAVPAEYFRNTKEENEMLEIRYKKLTKESF